MRSLRRLNIATFFVTALLLAALVVLGFRQNNLALDYSAIVQESESTIFLYTTIQDQATEGLLSRDRSQLFAAAKELEQLQSRYTAVLDNPLISSQYKLSFMRDLDLGRVIVNLRTLAEKPGDDESIMKIMGQLRHMNKQFLQFDRIVVNEMRSRVMEYQKMALIMMGMIISLACFSLIMLYRQSVNPLIVLAAQVQKSLHDNTPLHLGQDGGLSVEVRTIVTAINHLLQKNTNEESEILANDRREAEFCAIINESTNRLNGIINYAQLLMDTCGTETIGEEHKEIMKKIIRNGEQCAQALRKGRQ